MKRILILSVAAWLGGISMVRAQNNASAMADQQAAEERYQRLVGKLQDLTESQETLRKRLDDLQSQIKELREQQSKPNTDTVQRDELRKLAEQVKDIDEKRAADKELILKQIKNLGNTLTPAAGKPQKSEAKIKNDPAPDPAPNVSSGAGVSPDKNYEGYEHEVKSGETLMAIIKAYNKEYGLKLTVDQITKHPLNAKVNPDKLRVGQKIFIPSK